MKILLGLLTFVGLGMAQISQPTVNFRNTDPSGACANSGPLWYNWSGDKLWACANSVWVLITGGGSVGNGAQVINVAPAASMTFTATSNTITEFVAGTAGIPTALAANVTSLTVAGFTAGQVVSFVFQQAASGGPYSVAWPASMSQACAISQFPSAITKATFLWNGTNGDLVSCSVDRGPSQQPSIASPSGAPGPTTGVNWSWIDNIDNTLETKDGNGIIYKVPSFTSLNNHGVLLGTGGMGLQTTIAPAVGTVFNGQGSSADPVFTNNPQLGNPGSAYGTLGFCGATSGCATITPQTAAGTPTLTLPNASGTFAVSATAPLALSATTGNLTVALFGVNAQTSTYQVMAADFASCKTITVASGTFTVTLVASGSQPTSGQCIYVINYGSGVVTIARSGQNINGGTASLTLAAASATAPTGAYIVSDGTNYEAQLFGAPSSSALSSITAAAGANTIASGNNGLQIWNWAPTTNQVQMQFGETTAATSGTLGNQYIVKNVTLAGSTAVPMNITSSLTGSQTLPSLHVTPTWNTSGKVVAGILENVTNTASGAGSLLMDLQVGGTSQWNADKAGNTIQLGSVSTGNSPPACTVGSAGTWCAAEGTAPTAVTSVDQAYADSTLHDFAFQVNNGGKKLAHSTAPSPIHSTGNTAAISTATLCSASAGNCDQAGHYHVDWAFTQAGTACSTPGTGAVTFLLTWTDSNGTVHSATSLPMNDSASLVATSGSFTFRTTHAAAGASGSFNISSNGSIIQYATGYTACSVGTGTYVLDAAVTRLQ